MQNDEEVVEETATTDETEVEIKDGETEEVEETSDESTGETDTTVTTEGEGEKLTYEQKLARATTPEEKFAIADAEASKNRRLLHKANKPKAPTASTKRPTETSPAPKEPSVEETVLKANGMPSELLTQLKKIAKVNGTGLLDAQTDPIFIAVKDKFEKDKKRKEASLGAGRGAGGKKVDKSFKTPGLSRDEHKDMFYGAVRGK